MKLKLPSPMRKVRLFGSKPKRLQATARRVAPPAIDDYDADEPTTRFSTAFIVVAFLHIFAVGGVYVFKSMNRGSAPVSAEQTSTQSTPAKPSDSPAQPSAPAFASSPTQPAPISPLSIPKTTYKVKAGDSWAKIASMYSVSTSDLTQANSAKETTLLHPGQTLNIPAPKTVAKLTMSDSHKTDVKKAEDETAKPANPAVGKTYLVKKGDNLISIAHTLGVSQDELLKLNKIDDPKKLQIGATLKVPAPKKLAGN